MEELDSLTVYRNSWERVLASVDSADGAACGERHFRVADGFESEFEAWLDTHARSFIEINRNLRFVRLHNGCCIEWWGSPTPTEQIRLLESELKQVRKSAVDRIEQQTKRDQAQRHSDARDYVTMCELRFRVAELELDIARRDFASVTTRFHVVVEQGETDERLVE